MTARAPKGEHRVGKAKKQANQLKLDRAGWSGQNDDDDDAAAASRCRNLSGQNGKPC